MFHWLADKRPSDPTKLFQLDDGDMMLLLLYEQKAPWPVEITTDLGDDNFSWRYGGWNIYCDANEVVANWGLHAWLV